MHIGNLSENWWFHVCAYQNLKTGPQKMNTLINLFNNLETFEGIQNKNVVLGGDFNIILNPPQRWWASLLKENNNKN